MGRERGGRRKDVSNGEQGEGRGRGCRKGEKMGRVGERERGSRGRGEERERKRKGEMKRREGEKQRGDEKVLRKEYMG